MKIDRLLAREVLDSRGFPTVEVELFSGNHSARAMVPSGASTGEGEALELRDGDAKRFAGKGVLKAVENARGPIAKAVVGKEWTSQATLDGALLELRRHGRGSRNIRGGLDPNVIRKEDSSLMRQR